MTKKIIYMTVLVCGLSLLSSAKQIGMGTILDYKDDTTSCPKKKAVKVKEKEKKVITATVRPLHFYLFNI